MCVRIVYENSKETQMNVDIGSHIIAIILIVRLFNCVYDWLIIL